MREIFYLTSSELKKTLDNIDKIRHRSYLVDALLQAYELDKHENFHYLQPQLATAHELSSAHDRDYLDFLNLISTIDPNDDQTYRDEMNFYKIGYECPPFEELPVFCS